MPCLAGCGEFAGGVGGFGESDMLVSFLEALPRAAITSLRNELLLNRDMILSAVSGLLGRCQFPM